MISNVMVAVDPGAAGRIRLAAGLAERFGARLTGLAARDVVCPMPAESLDASGRLFEIADAEARTALAEARALFVGAAGEGAATGWLAARDQPLACLVEQARAADLVVIGREIEPDAMRVPAGPLLMEVGRPVLVVPPGLDHLSAARVVVAWKDTREARRAVHDALPFLTRAERAHVVAVEPEARGAGAEGVADYLSGHGVPATVHLLHNHAAEVADPLLRLARGEGADLIVMGAYGHSRLREWALGGATRDMLHRASVCCLMSH